MAIRPKVLHLAYEDHLAPGSGGGSVRTLEINSRLAERFEIHQVFASYPDARLRDEHGLLYRHLGPRRGSKFARQLGYFASLPMFLRRESRNYDLVVEDFGAPFGSIAVPHFTSRPTLSVVQWLFAAEKSRQYHLPFRTVENFGVRAHRRFIAVSPGIGSELQQRNPGATIDVIANGLPDAALARGDASGARRDILFLGRLEVEHKGLDLLLTAFASARSRISQNLVIAGDGDGEAWVRQEIARLGIADRVRLVGRIASEDRFDQLAAADVVAMPSRYESFGMVAAEAAAVGTPVVAFDIACLRDLIPNELLVDAFDTEAFADKLITLCQHPNLRQRFSSTLRDSVAHLSWDALADRQGQVYLATLGG